MCAELKRARDAVRRDSIVLVAEGALFVLCVLTFRRGLVGELGRLFRPSR